MSPAARRLLTKRFESARDGIPIDRAIEALGQSPRPSVDERSDQLSQRYPLSFTQQRLWFLEQLEPGSAAYNNQVVFRLRGELNTGALKAALDEIVRRNDVFRTAIVSEEGIPVQVISPAVEFRLQEQDLAHLSGDEQGSELQRCLSAVQQEAIDLSNPPLGRVCVIRLSPREHILSFTLHHIITDGWSRGLINKELSHYYDLFRGVSGECAARSDLPIP